VSLKKAVDRYPYGHFPVVLDGRLQGMVKRGDILSALMARDVPEVQRAVTCFPDQSVREVGDKFIESPSNILIVVDRESEAVDGNITLHDLIRAQASVES
jgi:CBS domain-containing protein